MTVEDLRDLLALLREHPDWRDAVRRELLTEEVLELPAVVARLAGRMDQLAQRTDDLTARMDQLAARMDQLAAEVHELATQMRDLTLVVTRLDGRVGNLEGWRYEQRFNARARVTEIVRRPVAINLADLEPVLDARDSGLITEEEWKHLLSLDFLLKGRLGPGLQAPEYLVALEVSQVVDSRDVQRAHDRAAILARVGLPTIAAVGGRRLTEDAAALADRLSVRTLVDSVEDE